MAKNRNALKLKRVAVDTVIRECLMLPATDACASLRTLFPSKRVLKQAYEKMIAAGKLDAANTLKNFCLTDHRYDLTEPKHTGGKVAPLEGERRPYVAMRSKTGKSFIRVPVSHLGTLPGEVAWVTFTKGKLEVVADDG